jgi:hypothetical protein
MRPLPAAAAAVLLLVPAAAHPTTDRVAQAADIPVEEWSAMASGRTLVYRINGGLWALEHYFPGTDRVQLQLYDGTCMDGTWDYAAPYYCFHWQGQGTSCFRHTRVGDAIRIIEAQDGVDTTMTQDMTAVTDVPLTCGPPATS